VGSATGNWMEQVGVVWILYELTGSPLLLGLGGLFRALPFVVLAPIAGALADRSDQRKMLLITQSAGLVASLALGLLIVSGQVQFWHVYLQVLVQSAISAFQTAARQALFPRLVPRTAIPAAVTLNSTAARTSGLIGPGLAGLLIAQSGDAAPFLVNTATFVLLIVGAAMLRDVPRGAAVAGSSVRAETIAGARYILRTPILAALMKLELAFALFSMNAVIITIIARQVLGVGAEGLGQLLSAPAVGGIAAIATLLWFGHVDRQGRLLYACGLFYAIAVTVFAFSTTFALSFAALAICGYLEAMHATTRNSIMQMASPPTMRGRVMGNSVAVHRGLSPLGDTQMGAVAAAIGGPLALGLSAGALLVAIGASALSDATLRRFSRTELVEAALEPSP
jgi:hypothetical protein